MNYKASNFKLNQSVKVYTLDTHFYIIEVRATKRKVDNEITYRLDVFACGKLYYINKTIWNTTLDHVNTLVNSLYEIEERRTRMDKVILFNEVLNKYR